MRILAILILSAMFLLNSCDSSTEPEILSDSTKIMELVLTDQFYDDYTGYPLDRYTSDSIVKVYFIGVYEEVDSNYHFPNPPVDPERTLLNQFSDIGIEVKPASQAIFADYNEYYDRTTNERGIFFFAGPIRWLSEIEAEVEAGYKFGGLSSHCLTYTVRMNDLAEWIIFSRRERWGS